MESTSFPESLFFASPVSSTTRKVIQREHGNEVGLEFERKANKQRPSKQSSIKPDMLASKTKRKKGL